MAAETDNTLPDAALSAPSAVPSAEPVGTEASATPVVASGTEAAGSQPESWLNDEYKALASSYGIGDDDLKDFGSAAEFNRVTRLIDKQLLNFAQTPTKETPPATPPAEQPTAAEVKQALKLGRLDKLDLDKLKAAGYDDDALAVFGKQNDSIERHNELVDYLEQRASAEKQFEDRFGKLEQGFQQFQQVLMQAESQRRLDQFHNAVDSLGDARYGKSLDDTGRPKAITEAEDAARRKLFETVTMLENGIAASQEKAGQQIKLPPPSVLLKRAHQLAFADDIRAEERRKIQEQIAEQSKKRRPVEQHRGPNGQFAPAPQAGPQSPDQMAREVAENPQLKALYERFQEENGQKVTAAA